MARRDATDARLHLNGAAPGADLAHLTLADTEPLGIVPTDLDKRRGAALCSAGTRPVFVRVCQW
jgi:hypothetical protein